MTSPPSATDESTRTIYDERYFQGGREKSNYDDYVSQSLGPSTILAETLFRFFRPCEAVDIGCAVGHTVKRLCQLGTAASGYDISDWAVATAGVPYVRTLDIAQEKVPGRYDLVYSYDVLEHLPINRLEFAARSLWESTAKDMLIVPATYESGEESDPNEPTHLIFKSRAWWQSFFTDVVGAIYDEEATRRFAAEEHSRIFNYSFRVMVFSRLQRPAPAA